MSDNESNVSSQAFKQFYPDEEAINEDGSYPDHSSESGEENDGELEGAENLSNHSPPHTTNEYDDLINLDNNELNYYDDEEQLENAGSDSHLPHSPKEPHPYELDGKISEVSDPEGEEEHEEIRNIVQESNANEVEDIYAEEISNAGEEESGDGASHGHEQGSEDGEISDGELQEEEANKEADETNEPEDLEDGEIRSDSDDGVPEIKGGLSPSPPMLITPNIQRQSSTSYNSLEAVSTRSQPNNRHQYTEREPEVCRFFLRGVCRNGDSCRFKHTRDARFRVQQFSSSSSPNLTTKLPSYYSKIPPPIGPPVPLLSKEIVPPCPLQPPPIRPPPPVNTDSAAWEQGLKKAREIVRRQKAAGLSDKNESLDSTETFENSNAVTEAHELEAVSPPLVEDLQDLEPYGQDAKCFTEKCPSTLPSIMQSRAPIASRRVVVEAISVVTTASSLMAPQPKLASRVVRAPSNSEMGKTIKAPIPSLIDNIIERPILEPPPLKQSSEERDSRENKEKRGDQRRTLSSTSYSDPWVRHSATSSVTSRDKDRERRPTVRSLDKRRNSSSSSSSSDGDEKHMLAQYSHRRLTPQKHQEDGGERWQQRGDRHHHSHSHQHHYGKKGRAHDDSEQQRRYHRPSPQQPPPLPSSTHRDLREEQQSKRSGNERQLQATRKQFQSRGNQAGHGEKEEVQQLQDRTARKRQRPESEGSSISSESSPEKSPPNTSKQPVASGEERTKKMTLPVTKKKRSYSSSSSSSTSDTFSQQKGTLGSLLTGNSAAPAVQAHNFKSASGPKTPPEEERPASQDSSMSSSSRDPQRNSLLNKFHPHREMPSAGPISISERRSSSYSERKIPMMVSSNMVGKRTAAVQQFFEENNDDAPAAYRLTRQMSDGQKMEITDEWKRGKRRGRERSSSSSSNSSSSTSTSSSSSSTSSAATRERKQAKNAPLKGGNAKKPTSGIATSRTQQLRRNSNNNTATICSSERGDAAAVQPSTPKALESAIEEKMDTISSSESDNEFGEQEREDQKNEQEQALQSLNVKNQQSPRTPEQHQMEEHDGKTIIENAGGGGEGGSSFGTPIGQRSPIKTEQHRNSNISPGEKDGQKKRVKKESREELQRKLQLVEQAIARKKQQKEAAQPTSATTMVAESASTMD